jgi:membrane associated rhomboid family serine protease
MGRVVRFRFFLFPSPPLTDSNLHVGAIYALASFFAFAAPKARFLLFFVVPMPAWACIGGIACFDAYNAVTRRVRHPQTFFLAPSQKQILPPSHNTIAKTLFYMQFSSLDSAGHVGGLTAGALYWIMRTRFRVF